jgi:hypothetical protein
MDNIYIVLIILLLIVLLTSRKEKFPRSYDYIRPIPYGNTNPILEADANAYLAASGYFNDYAFGDEFYLNPTQMHKNEGYGDLL